MGKNQQKAKEIVKKVEDRLDNGKTTNTKKELEEVIESVLDLYDKLAKAKENKAKE